MRRRYGGAEPEGAEPEGAEPEGAEPEAPERGEMTHFDTDYIRMAREHLTDGRR